MAADLQENAPGRQTIDELMRNLRIEEVDEVPDDFWKAARPKPEDGPAWVYRVIDRDTDRVIYVGQSIEPWRRLPRHKRDRKSRWWPARERITLTKYSTVAAFRRADGDAICAEDPPGNDQNEFHDSRGCQGPRCSRIHQQVQRDFAAWPAARAAGTETEWIAAWKAARQRQPSPRNER